MKQLLKNPLVVGVVGGIIACGAHYVNRKIVKKEEKVETTDLLKVFVAISVLLGGGMFVASKKNLLPRKLLSSGSQSSATVALQPVSQTGGTRTTATVLQSAPLSNMVSPQPMNAGGLSGNQTISNMPSPQTGGLQLSDINDIIHTGTPNF